MPETRRVIQMFNMRQLVDHQVAHYFGTLKYQARIEIDGAATRATAPACALLSHTQAVISNLEFERDARQAWLENRARTTHQPAAQQRPCRSTVGRACYLQHA